MRRPQESLSLDNEDISSMHVLSALISICSPKGIYSADFEPRTAVLYALPLLASPCGLLGNLASIMAVADKWRVDKGGHSIGDTWWVLLLNSLSLAAGCISSLVFFLHSNFNHVVPSVYGIGLTAVLYFVAVLIYMGLIAGSEYAYFHNTDYQHSAGFWQAVCASVLYFSACLMLAIYLLTCPSGYDHHTLSQKKNDISRFLLTKEGRIYEEHLVRRLASIDPAVRRHAISERESSYGDKISERQRHLMFVYMIWFGWIAMGAAVAAYLLNTTYSQGVYYCIVSCLTLGYGDVVFSQPLGKALTIPYLYIGVILSGLTAVIFFKAWFQSTRNQTQMSQVQHLRRKTLLASPKVEEEEAFRRMRHIVQVVNIRISLIRTLFTFLWLAVFWLIGAFIFSRTEGWDYFDAFYMCSVSLATVGYGDLVPRSPGGRSFFIHWAMVALPTMTAAVSDLTSFVMALIEPTRRNRGRGPPSLSSLDFLVGGMSKDAKQSAGWEKVLELFRDEPGKMYSFQEWHAAMRNIMPDGVAPEFWLTQFSPISMPYIDEQQFLILVWLLSYTAPPVNVHP